MVGGNERSSLAKPTFFFSYAQLFLIFFAAVLEDAAMQSRHLGKGDIGLTTDV